MLPGSQQRKKKNSTKINLVISVVFHAVIGGALIYLAAMSGALGKKAQRLVEVTMEKKEEKPKEPEKPKPEPPKQEAPKTVQVAKTDVPRPVVAVAPPPAASVEAPPASVAPPPAEMAAFDFGGGREVVSSKDPVELYKGLLEFSIRSRWDRPGDLLEKDSDFVAEIEVAVDPSGRISDPVWKKTSGNKIWDESVRKALASTASVSQAPPKNFPARVVIRFDVVEEASPLSP